MDAFATADELGVTLNRTFTAPEKVWVTDLLEDASTYLRDDVLGLQVYPQSQSSFTAYPDGGRVDLPQSPVVSVDNATRNAIEVPFTRRDEILYFDSDEPVDITFTFGYTAAPQQLKRWCKVLVSSALIPLEQNLGLTVGGLSSVALDDFKIAFADAGADAGMTLSDRNIRLLRDSFGVRGTQVVTTR